MPSDERLNSYAAEMQEFFEDASSSAKGGWSEFHQTNGRCVSIVREHTKLLEALRYAKRQIHAYEATLSVIAYGTGLNSSRRLAQDVLSKEF